MFSEALTSSQREVVPSRQGQSANATAPLSAERDANLLVPPGPSNAPAPADPSNAPTESAPANPLAGASSPPRLFEILVMAQIHILNADMTALNSRMDLMNNRITALEPSFNQLNATYLARAPDGRQDNQSGGVQSSGLDPRAEMESELAWLAAVPPPPASTFPGDRRGPRSGGVDGRSQAERELARLAARKARRGHKYFVSFALSVARSQ
ncbi:hypothetical protein KC318_g3444 [Hortaea werneckii]|nr:hypothetical protein KC334_g3639 [Hortaea werneckii]KAI7017767.1 hypothetical protein KC355_g3567 [Hortaea werneckii]KAI7204883.1 hypothetical protein KC324_g574 [Hortaea werneckii]KAI7595538.1 hypothetical protein KC316_g489 [Hortaea werneckii]KAI7671516.1 hypothetical protein KC318_g3444 [Hortaea werneckii]